MAKCKSITVTGKRCLHEATKGYKYCSQHKRCKNDSHSKHTLSSSKMATLKTHNIDIRQIARLVRKLIFESDDKSARHFDASDMAVVHKNVVLSRSLGSLEKGTIFPSVIVRFTTGLRHEEDDGKFEILGHKDGFTYYLSMYFDTQFSIGLKKKFA